MTRVGKDAVPGLDRSDIENTILETTDTLIAHLDRSFTFVYANRAYAEAAGHPVDSLVGRNYFDIFDIDANREYFRRVIEDGEPVYLNAHAYTPTGDRLNRKAFRDWSLLPVRDEAGQVTGMTMSGTEVTERVVESVHHHQIRDSFEHLYESRQLLALRADLVSRTFLRVSLGLAELLGYENPEVLIGMSVADTLVRPHEVEEMAAIIEDNRVLTDHPVEIKHRNGRSVWVEATAWLAGDGAYVEAVVKDISQHKSDKEALEQSELMYRQMFERNTSIKLLIDPSEGQIVDANQAACGFYGYGRDELLAMKITEINQWPPEEVAREMKKAEAEERLYFRFPHRLADGTIRQVEVYSGPVHFEGRHLLHSIIHDVTDRVEAERALAESERRYRDFIEGTDDLVVRVDTDGKFVFLNDASQRIYGKRPEELIGVSSFDFIHPEDRPRTEKAFAYWVQEEVSSASIQNRQISATGDIHFVSWNVNLTYDGAGNLVGVNGIARDITRLKEVEEALYYAQKQFKAIADYTCDWEYWQDTKGNLLWVNPSVTNLTGYTVRECLSMPGYPLPLVHTDDRERVAEMLSEESASDIEFRIVRKDESVRWMSMSWQPIQLDDTPSGIRASIHDITERKEMERQLREHMALFEEVERIGEIGWWYSDMATGKTFWSDQLYELYGLGDQKDTFEPSHEKFIEMVHPDDQDHIAKLQEQVLQGGQVKLADFRIIRGDGSIGYFRGSAKVLLNENGQPARMIGSNFDMTSRMETEQELLDHQFVQQEVAKVVNLGWFYHDLHTDEIFWSEQMYNMFGMVRGETAPSLDRMKDVVHPDDLASVHDGFTGLRAGQPMFSREFRAILPDGTMKNIVGFARMLNDSTGRPHRIVGAVLDITERKRHQEEIAKAQKLQSLGSVAGGIAHEFNNLLCGVLGNIAMAADELNTETEAYALLKEAERIAERTRELTSQLLTFSTGGKPVLTEIDLCELTRGAVPLLLKRSNCVARYDLPDNLPPVHGDRVQLTQVINNLVLNARDVMGDDGGTLTISGQVVDIDSHDEPGVDPGCYFCLRVTDTGPGIKEDQRQRIFDPFFTTKDNGHGLGLTASYSIARNHGGDLSLESTSNGGTTFALYLPVVGSCDVCTTAVEETDPEKNLVRVLVMDDEEALRRLAEKILERRSIAVDTANDGTSAVELVKQLHAEGTHYDIVILDLSVPGDIGGEKALAAIRDICPDIKAIVCSGYAADPVMANHTEYGFNAVLSKPYLPKELNAVVDELLKT